MLLANEFLTYLFKYIILGVIAIAGVMCGAQYKKSKAAKEAAVQKETSTEE